MTHEEIHDDLYDKYNALLEKVGECVGAVTSSNEINRDLIGLLRKVLVGAFIVILLLIFTLIFGALGERGFHAVTNKVPISVDAVATYRGDQDRHGGKTK